MNILWHILQMSSNKTLTYFFETYRGSKFLTIIVKNPTLWFYCYSFEVYAKLFFIEIGNKLWTVLIFFRIYGVAVTGNPALRGHWPQNYYFNQESKLQYTYFQKIKWYFWNATAPKIDIIPENFPKIELNIGIPQNIF